MSTNKLDSECEICNKPFSMIHLKHRCKKCQIAVCNQCSKHKWKLNINGQTQKKRVCDICFSVLSRDDNKPLIESHHVFQLTSTDLLTDPSKNIISVFLSLFNKCWLRSKYPEYYQLKIKELVQETMNKNNPNKSKKKKKHKMLHKSEPSIGRGFDFEQTPYKKLQDTHYNTTKHRKRNPIIVISAGVLWINILKAVGIPNCDAMGKPDPYCKYYVTSNDTYFAEDGTCIYPSKYTTKILNDTFTPEWDEEKSIIITNTTGKLVIELWDHERMTKDNYLGKVEIPLNSLYLHYSCNPIGHQMIDDWFEITVSDKYKNKVNNKSAPDLFKLHTNSSIHSTPIYSKLESIPNMDTETTPDYNEKCCIRLQMKLHSSWHGNLISHFDPILPQQQETKFDLNLTVCQFNKFLEDSYPIIDESNEQIKILQWIKYEWSIIYVILFTVFIFYPWFTMFYIQFRMLVYICHSYVNLDENRKKQMNVTPTIHCLCLCFGYLPNLLSRILVQHANDKKIEQETVELQKEGKKKDVEIYQEEQKMNEMVDNEETLSLGSFSNKVCKTAIKVSGLKSQLGLIQQLLILFNDGIEFIKSICKWKDEQLHIASMMVIGLFILCILSIIFRETNFFQYELYFIGMSILTFYSKPIQFLLWFVLGASYWYNDYYRHWKTFKKKVENISFEEQSTPKLLKPSTINQQIMNDLGNLEK